MSDYLDTMRDATAEIRHVADLLKQLGEAFYATGNRHISDKLEILSNRLDSAQKSIDQAVGRELSDRVRESEQSAINTVAASLLAIRLGDGEERES